MTRSLPLLVALGALAGCGGGRGEAPPSDAGPGERHAFTLRLREIPLENDLGRVAGMNLDGYDSDETHSVGCHQPDWTGPDGEQGVDNQLAVTARSGELQAAPGAPFDGAGTLTVVIDGVHGLQDEEVEVRIGAAAIVRVPMVGGRFQAIAPASSVAPTLGVFTVASPRASGRVALRGVAIEGRLTEDGRLEDAVVGGELRVTEMVEAAVIEPDTEGDRDSLREALESLADLGLADDGRCLFFSAGYLADAVP